MNFSRYGALEIVCAITITIIIISKMTSDLKIRILVTFLNDTYNDVS